ncbi:hypothetical protein [Amycolatopsis taiwanensis]|uniref:Uncharacterized protein n=1 Tax=Amycolatopsis taiwanensis TaxID=342230 RepID=A0A9W6VHI1_9PSEU|nr:hypothetical protein [Amycolatopsis taiwanensis]GLY68735.1 hypothetical protein Atai01_53540 [Amycolatopsis taiwanensis]
MTAVITHRYETAVATGNSYRYDRVVDIAGRKVRVRIERQFCHSYNVAFVDVTNDEKSWTRVVEDLACQWWNTTPAPSKHIDAAAVLGPVADQLLHRAVMILAPAPITPTLSPHVLDAVGALLATTHGYNGERRITPDDIAWASNHGGTLRVIEHNDGSVTFTKAHRDECPLITSSGTQDCDDECAFKHPAEARRWLDQ